MWNMNQASHYLRNELYKLIQNDKAIFDFLQNGSLDGIWYWDLENTDNEWMSPRFWTTLGYDPERRMHLSSEWQDLIHPKDLQTALQNFKKHCADPAHPYDQVVRYRHKDGSTVWVRCRGIAIRDKTGKPIRMLGAHTDLTQQKKIEKELRISEEKFKFLAENMGDVVWTIDKDFNTTYISPSAEKVFGFLPEERKNQIFEEMVTPDSLELIMKRFMEELEREQLPDTDPNRTITIDVEYYHRDGSIIWMENKIKAIRNKDGEIIGMYGASRDITDRKIAQNALIKEKDKLKEAILKIKKLSGLLPICASCKNIRDDKGYWNQIESYIRDHSEADFSHSICPSCAKKLYPDLDITG